MNVAVLLGGLSPERNVSISSGKAVINALKELDYNITAIDPAFGADGLRDPDNLDAPENFPGDEE